MFFTFGILILEVIGGEPSSVLLIGITMRTWLFALVDCPQILEQNNTLYNNEPLLNLVPTNRTMALELNE